DPRARGRRRLRLPGRGAGAVRARGACHRAHPRPVRAGPQSFAVVAPGHARPSHPRRRHAGPARRRAVRCYCCGCGRTGHPAGAAGTARARGPSDRAGRRHQPTAGAGRAHRHVELEAHRTGGGTFRAAEGRNTILSKQEKHMLNGQLPLTDLSFRATRVARRPRAAWVAGLIGLALLAGCSTTKTRAPVVDLSNQPAAAQPGGTYVVKPGDTLYQIARANNVDIESVKRWNNISDPNQISVGQVLRLSGSAAAKPAAPAPTPAPVEAKPVPLGEPETPPATTPPAQAPAPVATPPRASDASLITWGWPSSGPVTQTFSTSTKGIDIGGALGDPVSAAAD